MTFHTSPPDTPTGPRKPERSRSRLVDLLDVQFECRFAPLLVRWLYIGSLALIAAVTDRRCDAVRTSHVMVAGKLGRLGLLARSADLNRRRTRVGTRCTRRVRTADPLDGSRARETFHSTHKRAIPLAVVPPSGKRARPYGWRWSSPPEERPAPIGPGLLGAPAGGVKDRCRSDPLDANCRRYQVVGVATGVRRVSSGAVACTRTAVLLYFRAVQQLANTHTRAAAQIEDKPTHGAICSRRLSTVKAAP